MKLRKEKVMLVDSSDNLRHVIKDYLEMSGYHVVDFKEGANLVVQIPSFRHRDPQIYNYLRQSARDLLYECIRRRFKIALWRDVHNLDTAFTRKDLAIQAWMEHHGIEDTETNYFAVLKVYDRADAAYRKSESRKKMKKS